jgi:DNA-binding NarL/FixJ family response regulator
LAAAADAYGMTDNTLTQPSRPLRVLVVDDHPLVLSAVCRALDAEAAFDVVGSARSGAAVLPQVARSLPDVVVLDVSLPGADGLTCLRRIKDKRPEITIVMLSASADPLAVEAARQQGARGYIVKTLGGADLADALREALARPGFAVFGEGDAEEDETGLSERELSMLATLARGLSNKAIGRELWITEQTVKFHLTNIYRKLGVENRTQAVRFAYERGLVNS